MARSTRKLLPSTLITEASVSAGQPSRRAAWAAVVPESSSIAWRPKQARSTPPSFWMAAASMRAIAWGSTATRAGSEMSTASSAPIARACFNAIRASSPPTEMAVTVPLLASFSWSAASTANSSHGLMTKAASPQEGLPFSTLTMAVVSGVVFTQATSFKGASYCKEFLT